MPHTLFKHRLRLLAIGSLVIGLVLAVLFRIQIGPCQVQGPGYESNITLPFSHQYQGKRQYLYDCNLHSPIAQRVKLNIAVDDLLQGVVLNDEPVDLKPVKQQYHKTRLDDWQSGYRLTLRLNAGDNRLKVVSRNLGGGFGIKIAQGMLYTEYLVLFALLVFPALYLASELLHAWVGRLRNSSERSSGTTMLLWLPWMIIALGIALRLVFALQIPYSSYQHDLGSHEVYIRYFSENFLNFPDPDKGFEFSQQPLYYLLTGGLYAVAKAAGLAEPSIFFSFRFLGLLFSALGLWYGLRLIRMISHDPLVIAVFMGFLSFTPSFIMMSVRVNNDVLLAPLTLMALYWIVRFYGSGSWRIWFYAAFSVLAGVLTKLSALPLAAVFGLVLLLKYFNPSGHSATAKKQFFWYAMLLLFVGGFIAVKAYIPVEGSLRLINAWLYSDQIIPALDLNYFVSFSLGDMLAQGGVDSKGLDSVRYSLPTYLYGTMLIGEFNYAGLMAKGLFPILTQSMLLLGLVYPLAAAAFLVRFGSQTRVVKLLFIVLPISLFLMLKLLDDYWVVCHADFRFLSAAFGLFALMFALGAGVLAGLHPYLRRTLYGLFAALFGIQILWILKLAALS